MSEYFAKINWVRGTDETFIDNNYSRGHSWSFDGGEIVQASSSPQIVPPPYSVEENVDPEEAFVASLSSCHMLYFLAFAAKRNYVIDNYLDEAVGVMGKNSDGKMSITKVTLHPKIKFSGDNQPTLEQIEKIHHQSHERCIIANSVKTEVVIEIRA